MICPGATFSQQQSFHCFSYYKVLPGKAKEVRSMLETVDYRVQQERANSGAISAWYLFEMLSPTGASAEYDFIVVATTKRYREIYETPYSFDSAFKKVFRGKDSKFFADYYSKLAGSFRLVREEIYAGVAAADSSTPGEFQFKYLVADYMQPKPEKFGQYYKMEVDTFRLIHKERIKLGAISQWAFLQLILPFDMKTGYSYMALNFYKDIDMMMQAKYEEGVKKAFPTVAINDLFQSASAMRDNPKADMSRLVLYALPKR
jgi:hypothetical protein